MRVGVRIFRDQPGVIKACAYTSIHFFVRCRAVLIQRRGARLMNEPEVPVRCVISIGMTRGDTARPRRRPVILAALPAAE